LLAWSIVIGSHSVFTFVAAQRHFRHLSEAV
jgi:hypothetical protein